jgi:anti-sigma regulatory factor (Ser/Thr protein kinase)
VVPSLDLAVRYRSSEGSVQVGGDWFDVIPLPAGAVGLVMGDVEGHDSGAAALMGLIRSAVRAYAVEDHPPAVIMDLANQFLAGLGRGRMVTVSYSQVHPAERLVTTVSAGHLPSLIASQAGVVEVPTDVGPPLGVAAGRMLWPEHTSTLPRGCLFVLFTDGLVESRRDDISVGLDRVRAVLSTSLELPVEQVADELLACRAPTGEDDIALVTARVTSDTNDTEPRRITRRLPPSPAAVTLARRFTRQLLEEWGVTGDTAAAAELAVSELVTNAARHSEDLLELRLACPAEVLRVAVSDSSHRMPLLAEADQESTAGRGLLLVESVASRWGIESDGLGKVVWCEFDL